MNNGRRDTNSKYGWPRPRRQEELARLKQADHLPTFRLPFQGRIQDLHIVTVSIDLPKYRLANGRTVSLQEEYVAVNSDIRDNLFDGDPEMLDAQEAQHLLLLSLASKSGLLSYFRDPAKRQVEPLILDELGFVVNGNRRLSTWRDLLEKDPGKYQHFSHVDVVILPHCDEKEIDRLEAALQIEPDIKADYTWDAQANMWLKKQKSYGLSTEEIARRAGMKESEVRLLFDMRNYAEEYLRSIAKEHQWSLVSEDEYAFKKVAQTRAKLANPGEKELFKAAAFVLIANPDAAPGRLYDAIPRIQEYLPDIKNALCEEITLSSSGTSDEELDELFGGGDAGQGMNDVAMAVAIQSKEHRDRASTLIGEIIDSQEQLKKDQKTANYLLTCLGKANANMAAAVARGLRAETKKRGVKEQLDQLRQHIEEIDRWLS